MLKSIVVRCAILGIFIITMPAWVTNADAHKKKEAKAPKILKYEVPALKAWLVLSHPAYRAAEVDETPYRLMRLCDSHGRCKTLIDERKGDGFSIGDDSFSPDRMYVTVAQMLNVDVRLKTFDRSYCEIYGLREGGEVVFRTEDGKDVSVYHCPGWSSEHPHALKNVVAGDSEKLAYPVGEK